MLGRKELFTAFLAARCQVTPLFLRGPRQLEGELRPVTLGMPWSAATSDSVQSVFAEGLWCIGKEEGEGASPRLPPSAPAPVSYRAYASFNKQLDLVLLHFSWEEVVFVHCTVCSCLAESIADG